MSYKWASFIKILKRNEKIVLCNSETGGWIRISNDIFEIIKVILDQKLNINDIKDAFSDIDDYILIKSNFKQLIKEGYIVEKDIKFTNVMVSIEMTHRCNLHCIHCCIDARNNLKEDADLTTAEMKEAIDKIILWNSRAIMLSGGEVMMRKDFFEVLRYLRKSYSGRIIVSTNGTLINEENVQLLCDLSDQIDISLDGVDEESTAIVRGKDVFNKVITSVKLIKNTGFENLSLSMVISDKNAHLENKFRNLNEKLGTKAVVRAFVPFGRGREAKTYFSNKKSNEVYIGEEYLSDKYNGTTNCSTCVSGTREIFVNYKGDIYPCPNCIKNEFKMGNIFQLNKIEEVTDNSDIHTNINSLDIRNKGKCKNCSVKEFCWTCPAEALSIENKEAFEYRCSLIKPVLLKRIWGE